MPGLSNLEDSIRGIMDLLLNKTEADALLLVTMTEEEPDMVSVDTALAAPTSVAEDERLPFIIARAAEEDIRSYDDHAEDKSVHGDGLFADEPTMETLPLVIPDLDPIAPEYAPEYHGFEEPEGGSYGAEMPPAPPMFSAEVEMWSPPRGNEGSITMTENVSGYAEQIVAHLRRIADDIERDAL